VPACCRRRGEVQDHLHLHQFSARRRRRSCRFSHHFDSFCGASALSFLLNDRDHMISSCSRSNHRFRTKIQLLFAIAHPLCGSMHVLRPSVVLIHVVPSRFPKSSDSARILTYPPLGIS